MAGVDEVLRQESAAAAELEHDALAVEHRLQQPENAGRAHVGVEPEPQVMDEGEVVPVVGRVGCQPNWTQP